MLHVLQLPLLQIVADLALVGFGEPGIDRPSRYNAPMRSTHEQVRTAPVVVQPVSVSAISPGSADVTAASVSNAVSVAVMMLTGIACEKDLPRSKPDQDAGRARREGGRTVGAGVVAKIHE